MGEVRPRKKALRPSLKQETGGGTGSSGWNHHSPQSQRPPGAGAGSHGSGTHLKALYMGRYQQTKEQGV